MIPDEIKIDVSEEFPHLSKAPIEEAIIDVRCKAEGEWNKDVVREGLNDRVGDYVFLDTQTTYEQSVSLAEGALSPSIREVGWNGVRFRSSNGLQIVNFSRDGFSFSRLRPYNDWSTFSTEALRLWNTHFDVARPVAIQRIGLRFINLLELPTEPVELDDFIQSGPKTPVGLTAPLLSFLHQESLEIPGNRYTVNITRTIGTHGFESGFRHTLIVDIDVLTLPKFLPEFDELSLCLLEMRWLKNKAFFGSVKPAIIERLR